MRARDLAVLGDRLLLRRLRKIVFLHALISVRHVLGRIPGNSVKHLEVPRRCTVARLLLLEFLSLIAQVMRLLLVGKELAAVLGVPAPQTLNNRMSMVSRWSHEDKRQLAMLLEQV